MPTGLRFWQIQDDRPAAVDPDKLDYESRLEEWLRNDISLVSDDLLVIGQQVKTEYGGAIDLLAMDSEANLVVLELKKGQTPREVVAQALDYASWVQRLDYDKVMELVLKKFGSMTAFKDEFRKRFGEDMPEAVNDRHRMYIVASSLDPSTERIIEYLAEVHDVDINAATFTYFKTDGMEWLGRSMLLDEEAREDRTENRNPTLEEFKKLAKDNGVMPLWEKALEELNCIPHRTLRKRHSLLFRVRIDGTPRWFLRIYPGNSSKEQGLSVAIHRDHLRKYFDNIADDQLSEVYGSDSGEEFYDAERLEGLMELLKRSVPQSVPGGMDVNSCT